MTQRGDLTPAQRARLRASARRVETAEADLRVAVRGVWRGGGSVRQIATELGRSTATIQRWLAAAGHRDVP